MFKFNNSFSGCIAFSLLSICIQFRETDCSLLLFFIRDLGMTGNPCVSFGFCHAVSGFLDRFVLESRKRIEKRTETNEQTGGEPHKRLRVLL